MVQEAERVKRENYQAIGANCCKAVIDVVKAGGFKGLDPPKTGVCTPGKATHSNMVLHMYML